MKRNFCCLLGLCMLFAGFLPAQEARLAYGTPTANLRLVEDQTRDNPEEPIRAAIRFDQAKGPEDLRGLVLPGEVVAIYHTNGFRSTFDPHGDVLYRVLAETRERFRSAHAEIRDQGDIDQGVANIKILGFMTFAKPQTILLLLRQFPGSEIDFVSHENTTLPYELPNGPSGKGLKYVMRPKAEVRASRNPAPSITSRPQATADLPSSDSNVRFLPTRGNVKVEPCFAGAIRKRCVIGEFYWDTIVSMDGFRDNVLVIDGYEHEVLFPKVHKVGDVDIPDPSVDPSTFSEVPHGFFLGPVRDYEIYWQQAYFDIQGKLYEGAGTPDEWDFTVGSYNARQSFRPGVWYSYTLWADPGYYVNNGQLTDIATSYMKLSGHKIKDMCNSVPTSLYEIALSAAASAKVAVNPLRNKPYCMVGISDSDTHQIITPEDPIDHTRFSAIAPTTPIPTDPRYLTFDHFKFDATNKRWYFGKPKPDFSVTPVQPSVSISPGSTSRIQFAVRNQSLSDEALTIAFLEHGHCRSDAVALLGITLVPYRTSTFSYDCYVPVGTAGTTSALKLNLSVAGVSRDVTVILVPSSTFSVSCAVTPVVILERQSATFKATPTGGIPPYSYSWTGAVSGTSQSISRIFGSVGIYPASIQVTDKSSPPQRVSRECALQVNGAAPSPSGPVISKYDIPSSPLAGQAFGVRCFGSGFEPASLQIWFFGVATCQAGCRHPDAGVLGRTTSSAELANVRMAQDTYRMKVRNGDYGSWSDPSGSFQVLAVSAPNFDLTTLNASKSVQAGQSIAFDMGLTPKNSFAEPIAWLVSGLPSGVSVTNANQQVNFIGSSAAFSVNLQTSSTAVPGTYPLAVKAAGGNVFQTVNLTLSVTAAPSAPNILGISVPGAAVAGSAFDVDIVGTGLVAGSLQIWVSGATSCQAGCQHPPAGVQNVTPTGAKAKDVNLAAGSYRLKLRNGDAGQWSNESATFVVQAPTPSFDVVTLGATQALHGGGATAFNLGIISNNGFAGIVQWQLTGLPAGAVVTNASRQVTVGGSSAGFDVSIQTTTNVSLGSFPLTVTATSGSLSRTLNLTLIVNPLPLSGSCVVNGQTSAIILQVGNQATFIVTASGGTPTLHFSWLGIGGNDSNASSQIYSSAGIYDVSAVTSDSAMPKQVITVSCPRVTVVAPALTLSPISTFSQLKPGALGGLVSIAASFSNIPANSAMTQSISNLPSGVTATLGSQTVGGSGSVTLNSNFSVSTIAQPGTYLLTAVVTVAFVTKTLSATLEILAPPPLSVSNCAFTPSTIWAGQSSTASVATPTGGTPPYSYSWSGAVSGSSQSVNGTFWNPGSIYNATLWVSDGGSGVNWQSRQTSCSVQTNATNAPPQNVGLTHSPAQPKPGNVITINLFSTGGFSSNTQVWVFGVACVNGCQAAIVGGSINAAGTSMRALAQLNNSDNFQIRVRNTSSGAFVLAGTIGVH